MLTRQVRVFRTDRNPPERRSGGAMKPFVWQLHLRMLRRSQDRRAVVGKEVWRLEVLVIHDAMHDP